MSSPARMPRTAGSVLLLLFLTLSLGVSTASGAVTLGSPLDWPASGSASCGIPLGTRWTFSATQTALPGATLTAPFDGIIVRWRLRATPNGAYVAVNDTVWLDVLDGDYGLVRSSAPSLLYPGPFGATEPEARDARLFIAAGQRIAVSGDVIRTPAIWGRVSSPGQARLTCNGTTYDSGGELLLNADVEPDADRDGYGDETQDACPSRADLQTPCPVTPSAVPAPAVVAPVAASTPSAVAPAWSCRVPKLLGSTVAVARQRLKASGCALGVVRTARRPHRRAGRVLSQSRSAGTRLTAGAKVAVTVSRR